jgi:transposase
VWLLNAQHLKNVPGRKTDVADSVWSCQLVEHAPGPPVVRAAQADPGAAGPDPLPQGLLGERTREVQRLHKVPGDAGTRAGQRGQRPAGRLGPGDAGGRWSRAPTTQVLAELARGRLRAKLPALREALEGRFGAHHGLLVGEMLARIDQMDEAVERLARRWPGWPPVLAAAGVAGDDPGGEPAHR